MPYHMKLPRLGAEMSSVRIIEWLKNESDWVEENEAVLAVETNKITIEVEAPASGYLLTLKQVEDEVEIGEQIAILCESEEEYAALSNRPPTEPDDSQPEAPAAAPDGTVAETAAKRTGTVDHSADRSSREAVAGKMRLTPLARKMAREFGLNLGALRGSGPRGTIKKRDVLREIEKGAAAQPQTGTSPSPTATAPERKVQEIIPLKGMRKRIAERLSQSIHQMAQFTDMGEINVDALVAFRKALVGRQAELGVKVSYNAILLKMISLVLREFPIFNAALIDEKIHIWKNINIGFAVALDDGLIVPVIHDCDQKSIVEIQNTLNALIEKAKTNQFTAGDISNGTVTVSNFGSYGTVYGTPIINPPETALLGLGLIRQVPVIAEGGIVARWTMNYSLTMDHRVIDGAQGGQLIGRLRMLAETPELLGALW